MSNKIIIGLVGKIACGKEAVKKYLVSKFDAEECRFSTPLRDVLNRMGVDASRENLQKVSTVLRQSFGDDLLAKTIAIDSSKLDEEIVVIDGVRRLSDIKYLKELNNFYLVSVEADSKLRYERTVSRKENTGDDKKTYEQFILDEQAEADREIPVVMETAKYVLDNNGTLEELFFQIDGLINNILK
jgi:dephospho-CoA kinase